MNLPYLTPSLPGVGGEIKQRPEDFRVEEAPLYEASGEGAHTYLQIRKVGIPTAAAVDRIARHMGVRPTEIGLAGLKDAHAVTTQWLSLEHADEARLAAFRDRQVDILSVTRHTNKLRPGHLAGNRFAIRIRGAGEGHLPAARAILEVLRRRGVPNYFGEQRFGAREDTARLGEQLVRGNLDEFVALYLGRPRPDDPPDCRLARDAFDIGDYARALKRWPRHYANERRALSAYRKKHRAAQAVSAVDKRMRRFYVSAFQSAIFNEIVARRIETLDTVLEGDYARKTDTGGVFLVEELEAERPRAEAREISPAGLLPGYRCRLAGGEPGRIEAEALAAFGVTLESFDRAGALRIKGTRRALRFLLDSPHVSAGADEHGEYLELSFAAPSGCYATVTLREVMKNS